MKFPTIYKRTKTGATQEWTIEVEGNKYRTIAGQTSGKKMISKWTVCESKNDGKTNGTTPSEQAQIQAQRLRERKLEKEYKESVSNIDEKNFVQTIQPMLAAKWEDIKDKVSGKVFVQSKLDGIRCIITKHGMWSRNGKPLPSAPHIFKEVKHVFDKYPEIVALDGELYNHGLSEDFNKIISIAKKTKPTLEDLKESEDVLQFWNYDVILSTNPNFSERIKFLEKLHKNEKFSCSTSQVVLVDTFECKKEEVDGYLESMIDQMYEGLIVRLDKPYEQRRSKGLLKYKVFMDEEFPIDDIEEGEGNRTGIAGNIITHNRDGKPFHSNLKFDHNFCRDLLINKKKYIGKSCTIKFFQYTPGGIPRFPFVINIGREDYE